MIDVNKITSTLAKLPDAMLQKYAQLNKADPYIMALAMSESNRRKELRSAGQGAQGMQEQPKVVDKMVAEMAPQQLPEEQGIGQLNAGDMNFAGGGIIAFADGGDVERYQVGGITAKYQQESQEMGMGTRMQYSPDVQAYAQAQEQASKASYADRERALMLQGPYGRTAAPTQVAPAEAPVNYDPTENLKKIAQTNAKYVAPASTPKNAEEAALLQRYAPSPAKAAPKVEAAPKADTTRKAPGAGPSAAPAAAGPQAATETGPSGIDALQQKYFGPIDQEVGGLRNARAGLVAGIKDLAEQNLAATKADIEKRGDVYKGREERLAKQEKGLEGMSDKNMGLALLQAGAAMMSTPGGIGVALGKGVQVGSERYAAGLDKIEAAKSKFAEARDRLDDLRINRDDMNAKDIRAAEKEARESKLKGQELLYNGLVSDLGMKQKNVTAIFGAAAGALENDKKIASSEKIAAIGESGANARSAAQIAATLNTPDRILFDQLLKKNENDAVKALEAFKVAKGDKFDVRSSYADYLKAFAGKEGLTPPMSMGAYAGQFGAMLPR
jgi:hypothetical protein